MGRFDFSLSEDLLKQLGALGGIDEIAPKMLNEALPKLRDALKKEVQAHYSSPGRKMTAKKEEGLFGARYGKYAQTGSMLNSIKMSRSRKIKNGGFYANVYFKGDDSKGFPNAAKAIIFEYGSKKQLPSPFLTKIVKNSESDILKTMQEVFEREVKLK